ncbi:lectin-like domain-containing protein [Lacticaseibacillus hulanensis]|uniref:lectin-like domain-containing protein n=1 Tax=Lacticaseibacillus hulanensis TaxID=2493111 RepID=UPI000FD84000|nr:KxYKxGKxW signal peptide domain-containing protein [Lacticaseibacillus hulanensis]
MQEKPRRNTQDVKCRFKMYKAGKQWLVAGMLFLGTATGLSVGGNAVQADAGTSTNFVQAAEPVTSAKQTDSSDQVQQATAKTDTAQDDTATKADSAKTDVATSDSTVAAKPADAGTPADTATAATTPADKTDASTDKATDDATTGAANQTAQAGSATATPATASTAATDAKSLSVNKDNFADAFNFNGSAKTADGQPKYDKSTGTVTLTDFANQQAGSVTLKNKISLDTGFDLKGEINIGTLDQIHGGGDGIAFGFHDANSDLVGMPGAGLGLAGIPNAIGWKADTTLNWGLSNDAEKDPAEFGNPKHNPADTGYGDGHAFGAFITTTGESTTPGVATGLEKTVGVTGGPDSAQQIDDPAPGPKDDAKGDPQNWVGAFKDIEINYNPDVDGKKLLTVKYDDKIWQKDITDWAADKTDTALFISAGSAANKNLQQFRIKSFEYLPAATVDVKYVFTSDESYQHDLQGDPDASTIQEIPNFVGRVDYPSGTYVGEPYFTYPQSIAGYEYMHLAKGSLPETGTLSVDGNNGTVTYLYVQNGNGGQKASVEFIDNTDHKQLGQTVYLEGQAGAAINYSDKERIEAYEAAGYQYDAQADETLHDGFTFDADNATNQMFKVYLTHKTSVTQDSKTITRNIQYVKASDGTQLYAPVAQPLTFTRDKTTDLVTGKATDGAWSAAQTFGSVVSPTSEPGFEPDVPEEAALTVDLNNGEPTPDQLNLVVKYTQHMLGDGVRVWTKTAVPDENVPSITQKDYYELQKAFVTFLDKVTGQQIADTVEITGKNNTKAEYSDAQTVAELQKAGYAYDQADDETAGGITFDSDSQTDQYFKVYLTHKTTATTETKVFTRKISYVKASDGKQLYAPYSDKAEFTRTKDVDSVTGKITYGKWSPAQTLSAVKSPTTVPDYTPDVSEEPELTIDLQNNQVPTDAQLNLVVKYAQHMLGDGIQVWTKSAVPDENVPHLEYKPGPGIQVWTKSAVPDENVPHIEYKPGPGIRVWTKTEVPNENVPHIEYKPGPGIRVWTKTEVPNENVPHLEYKPGPGIRVWTKTQVPNDAPHVEYVPGPGIRVWTKTEVPNNAPFVPAKPKTPDTPGNPQTPDTPSTGVDELPPLPNTFGGNDNGGNPPAPSTPQKPSTPRVPSTTPNTQWPGLPQTGGDGARLVATTKPVSSAHPAAAAALPSTGNEKSHVLAVIGMGMALITGLLGLVLTKKHGTD